MNILNRNKMLTNIVRNKLYVIIIISLVILELYIIMSSSKPLPINLFIPTNLEQDALKFLPKEFNLNDPLLSTNEQMAKTKDFLKRHFSPWSSVGDQFCINADTQACHTVISMQQDTLKDFQQALGFDQFYQPYKAKWLKQIISNMRLEQLTQALKQQPRYGIMTSNTALRSLPTFEPNYNDVITPGEGHPFDRLQESAIWLSTPLRILHETADKKWRLVLGPSLLGWVPADSVAYVNKLFMQRYQSYTFATPIVREYDLQLDNHTIKRAYLGVIYPLLNNDGDHYQIGIPVREDNQQAELHLVTISKQLMQPWPLKPTPSEFSLLINQLLGMPYGWGDLDFNSDCSGTLRRLLSAFAIWLPRNSHAQAHYAGQYYSLSALPVEQRQQILAQGNASIPKAIPYLSLLSFGGKPDSIGHIALYLGQLPHSQEALIFQSAWGLKIYQGNDTIGRAIMGKAVITPLSVEADIQLPNKLTIRALLESPELGLTII